MYPMCTACLSKIELQRTLSSRQWVWFLLLCAGGNTQEVCVGKRQSFAFKHCFLLCAQEGSFFVIVQSLQVVGLRKLWLAIHGQAYILGPFQGICHPIRLIEQHLYWATETDISTIETRTTFLLPCTSTNAQLLQKYQLSDFILP